jgi:phosphohistidine swiveling domain-containing protein
MATIEEQGSTTGTEANYKQVGEGQNVLAHEPVEGPCIWLDTPEDVIEFVMGPDVEDSIVISRSGSTTFVAPALTAGVKALITLEGTKECHLGIVSREFGIPCVMSVAFSEGVTTAQGDTVPADGTVLRLECAAMPTAAVLVKGE